MDDVWLCIDENSSSSHNSTYSDNVDSEVEAELYGMIHHQENLNHINNSNGENPLDIQASLTFKPVSNQINNFSCAEIENVECNLISSNKPSINTKNLNPKEALYNIDQNSSEQDVPKLNRSLKRKSDSKQDSFSSVSCSENVQTKNSSHLSTPTLNNVPIKKNCRNFSKRSNFSKTNETTIVFSSDSDDSVIWTEPDSSFRNDLKINLLDTISINSNSSEDSFVISSSLQKKELNLNNLFSPNIKLGESSKDIWQINEDDLYRSKKKYLRYHENIGGTHCSNCNERGHKDKFCPVSKTIKCFYCGGSHVGSVCENKVCRKCHNTGHDSRYCWMHHISSCHHCNMKGHFEKDCPDIWRRYHLTTKPLKIVAAKPVHQDRIIYCYNCGCSGHFGAECKELRAKNGSFVTWPCVISYSNPDELLAKRFYRRDHPENSSQHNFTPERRVVNATKKFRLPEAFAGRNRNSYNLNLPKHCKTVQNFIAERRKENQTQEKNLFQGIMTERKDEHPSSKKEFEKFKKWKFFKQRSIERKRQKNAAIQEKDFPRTPKKPQINLDSTDAMPESVTLTLNEQLKKKKKNRKRKWKRFLQNKKSQGENS